jgi:hypothetical protein
MTDYQSEEYARIIDCGDGVPTLSFRKTGDTGEVALDRISDRGAGAIGTIDGAGNAAGATGVEDTAPTISAWNAAILATIIGQIAIGLAVILGANPIVGGAAALAMMLTGIGLAVGAMIGASK